MLEGAKDLLKNILDIMNLEKLKKSNRSIIKKKIQ